MRLRNELRQRRRFAPRFVSFLVLPWLGALGLLACGGGADAPPRNLLFVSIDTLRADALGVYGSERGATPHLDALAERGVLFASAWSHSPKTAPAHMTMLTGLPPRVHGVGNLNTAGARGLSPDVVPLAESLARAGFDTAGFTSGGNVKGELGFARGFDLYEDTGRRLGKKLPAVKGWLRERDEGRRWFLFLHTYQVHDPYLPSAAWRERFTDPAYSGEIVGDADLLRERMAAGDDRAPNAHGHDRLVANFWYRVDRDDPRDLAHLEDLYTAGVAETDQLLGDFLAWMEARGLLEDTLVVVTSDHGEEFGEHGDVRHEQLWREVLAVPLIVQLPRGRAAGTVVEAPVRHMDLVPSLLELLDVADPAQRLGQSWAPWLRGADPGPERPAFAEHRSRRELDLDLWSLRRDGWLLHRGRQGTELYSTIADPDERRSLDDPTRAAELEDEVRRTLGALQTAAGELGAGEGIELDAELRAELEALGYLGASADEESSPR